MEGIVYISKLILDIKGLLSIFFQKKIKKFDTRDEIKMVMVPAFSMKAKDQVVRNLLLQRNKGYK